MLHASIPRVAVWVQKFLPVHSSEGRDAADLLVELVEGVDHFVLWRPP